MIIAVAKLIPKLPLLYSVCFLNVVLLLLSVEWRPSVNHVETRRQSCDDLVANLWWSCGDLAVSTQRPLFTRTYELLYWKIYCSDYLRNYVVCNSGSCWCCVHICEIVKGCIEFEYIAMRYKHGIIAMSHCYVCELCYCLIWSTRRRIFNNLMPALTK